MVEARGRTADLGRASLARYRIESGPGGGLVTLFRVVFEGDLDDDVNSDVEIAVRP